MKLIAFAAALLLAAPSLAFAQAAQPSTAPQTPPIEVPKPNCGTPPELPGRLLLQEANVQKRFQNEVNKYKECMKAYVDDRQAVSKANADAGNAAINEYNAWAKALDEEQKRRRGESSGEGAAPNVKSY